MPIKVDQPPAEGRVRD